MILSPSLSQTLILFILMGVGFAAGKIKFLDEAGNRAISKLLVNFILPALIIDSMQRPFSPEMRDLAYSTLGLSFVAYGIAVPFAWLLVKAVGAKGGERGAHAFGAIFSNCAFMGFPVIEAILGKDAIFAASVANIPFQLLAFSVGPFMLARTAGHGVKLGARSFVTPAAVSAFVGFALFAGGVALPATIASSLKLLGSTTTPMSMVLIGSIVSRMDWKSAVARPKVYATSIYRLAVFPLGLYALLRALGASGLALSVPVVLSAMPVAANSAILAEAYGGDAETASSLVLVSTLLSVATIPVLASFRFPA
jgi:malate permease and related proteins